MEYLQCVVGLNPTQDSSSKITDCFDRVYIRSRPPRAVFSLKKEKAVLGVYLSLPLLACHVHVHCIYMYIYMCVHVYVYLYNRCVGVQRHRHGVHIPCTEA